MNRDLRIDFLRGLVLLWIVADHVFHNETTWFVSADWVFFDCAAAFVFISGLVCGKVYGRTLRQHGLWPAQRKALKRCGQLYLGQIGLFAAVATIMAFTGFREPMTTEVGLNALLADPTGAIPRALTLSYTPWLLDILKLYIVLLLALPVVLWVYGRSRIAVAGFSLTLYAMAHHFDWFTLTEYPRALAWFWNPFSWQLLFLGAAMIGFQNDQGWRVPRHPALHAMAGCLVISAAYLAHTHLLGPGWTDRQTLAPAHLVSFAAVAYLASGLLHPGWRFWKSTIARPIVACGQHSLLVFCTGVLVSYGLSLALERTTSRVVEALIIAGGVAIAMLAGLAAGPLGLTKATRTGATAADITEVPTPADATSVMPAREIEPLLVHSCSTTVLSASRRLQAPSCAEPDGTGAEVNAETVPV